MDAFLKLKAFATTVECGSFSDAARKQNISPSVVMKRVNELELDLGTELLSRSTRKLMLTDLGQIYLPKIQRIMREYEELRTGSFRAPGMLEGEIRIKLMAVLATTPVGTAISDFQKENARLKISVVASDIPGNPIREGFDIVIATNTASYDGVFEERLQLYPRIICAAPSYLEANGAPEEPRDLNKHACLDFGPAGSVWSFQTSRGVLNVEVQPVFSTNIPTYLSAAARNGGGIVRLSEVTARPFIEDGSLVPILTDYPLVERWVKIMVPESRLHLDRVRALVDVVRGALATPLSPA